MTRAWHFINGDKLRDGTTAPLDGEWLAFKGKPILCEQGLHASIHPYDALKYAPGSTLCLVDCDGTIVQGEDKLVCTVRRIVARMDAQPLLAYFARYCALSVVHLAPPMEQCVYDFLMGEREIEEKAFYACANRPIREKRDDFDINPWSIASRAVWVCSWAAHGVVYMKAAARSTYAAADLASFIELERLEGLRQDFLNLVSIAFEDWL